MTLALAALIIVAAIALMARRAEVRLVLLGAGLLLATLAGRPLAIADAFAQGMVAAMVAPICVSMGFAAVLEVTGCDRHLVHLLLAPLRRAPRLVVPGGIFAAFLANAAVPSQASTAAMLGPILIPLIVAAGHRVEVAGAALVLGASFGGDLLNPAAQDYLILAGSVGLESHALCRRVAPALAIGLTLAALVFAARNRPPRAAAVGPIAECPRTDLLRALIPLAPIALLVLRQGGWWPLAWLVAPAAKGIDPKLSPALPVVRAMLVGAALAAIVGWRDVRGVTLGLFEGMGRGYAAIISLTICAQCFGAGFREVGLDGAILRLVGRSRGRLDALAIAFPLGMSALTGSGSGPIQVFAQAFLATGGHAGSPRHAAMACLAGAFGRTISPVSAVVVCGSGLAGVSPVALLRRLAPALIIGGAASILIILTQP